MIDDGEDINIGKVLVKIPRKSAKAGDITGGLPRVTELFEARNPSKRNYAINCTNNSWIRRVTSFK